MSKVTIPISEFVKSVEKLNPSFWVMVYGDWDKPLTYKVDGEGNNRFVTDDSCKISFGYNSNLDNAIQLLTILDMVRKRVLSDYKLFGFGECEI